MKTNLTLDFIDIYWRQYISIEKEFVTTIQYLSLDKANESAFSQAYVKLLLEIGSEIDIVLKIYCGMLDASFSGDNILMYRKTITENEKSFCSQKVKVLINRCTITPWEGLLDADGNESKGKAPSWWRVYNKVKHNRTEKIKLSEINTNIMEGTYDDKEIEVYKLANQKYVLLAIAALYQTLICIYYRLSINEDTKIKTPIPGSRLFELVGEEWESVQFYRDIAFWIEDDGCLYYDSGRFSY